MDQKLLFLDTETTGIDSKINGLHQISGAVVINQVIVETFDIKIKPFEGCIIDKKALEINNLTESDLFDIHHIDEKQAYQEFLSILSKYVNKFNKQDKFFLVGYNVHFDKDFLYQFFVRNNDNYMFSYIWGNHIDVMVLATYKLMDKRHLMENFKQGTLAKSLGFDIKEDNLHDALYDIFVCIGLYCHLTDTKFEISDIVKINDSNTYWINVLSPTLNDDYYVKQVLKKQLFFGKKHYGKTFEQIIEEDPQYIIWLSNNVKTLNIDEIVLFTAIERNNQNCSKQNIV